jgi:hypothetical protein
MNQMWILTNSKDLLEYMIHSRFLSSCNRFKTFDFSTLYTTILPHTNKGTSWRKEEHSLYP